MARIRERCGVKGERMQSHATRSMRRRINSRCIAGTEMAKLRGDSWRIASGRMAMVQESVDALKFSLFSSLIFVFFYGSVRYNVLI
jgi:hypothetical protein